MFKMKKSYFIISASLALLGVFYNGGAVKADDNSEIARINSEYQSLDRTTYDRSNTFAVTPHNTSAPFGAGQPSAGYINKGVQWWNFIRDLYGLPRISTTSDYNSKAQLASAGLTATGFPKLQHIFFEGDKPAFISDADWYEIGGGTQSSALAMNALENDVGGTIETLFKDSNNVSTNSVGHRASVLYWDFTGVGIGTAFSNPQYGLSTGVTALYLGDRANSVTTSKFNNLTYPNQGVFPIQYAVGAQWSIFSGSYDSNFDKDASVTIRNNTTGQNGSGVNLNSNGSAGSYRDALCYTPSGIDLRSGDSYTVTIHNAKVNGQNQDYTYSFKLFTLGSDANSHQYDKLVNGNSMNASDQNTSQPTSPNNSSNTNNNNNSVNVPNHEAGTAKEGTVTVHQTTGASLYTDKGVKTGRVLEDGTAWQFHRVLTINDHVYYLVGYNEWLSDMDIHLGTETSTTNNQPKNGWEAHGISTVISTNGADVYTSNGQKTGGKLDFNTAWKFDYIAKINGKNYYQVGYNQYLAEDKILNAGYSFWKDATTNINYNREIAVWSQPTWASSYLKSIGNWYPWHIVQFSVDSEGNLWYDLGGNQWMPALYGTNWHA